jgi:hypothetical protein
MMEIKIHENFTIYGSLVLILQYLADLTSPAWLEIILI